MYIDVNVENRLSILTNLMYSQDHCKAKETLDIY